ncbi:MAG TPA: tripartite tricarboxylate transporter substrate-binding protein [Xanthobacteraceae bacterium]|jgi:tripartite-type tricarboxylate transporter receptor subunit TctC|nr:tripartite tricarboxylate transporter substrate-binding protein [Xanthobacteraceae bacterium]
MTGAIMRVIRTIIMVATVIAALPAAAQTSAPTWPAAPVSLVVPFAAGGPMDTIGRILAPRLGEILGQQVVIENVGGAGGMTGTARVAKAAPDGYQLVLGNIGTHAQNQTLYKHPLYDAAADFAPVALIAETPLVLIARPDLPADDLPGFIAYARAHEAAMQFGSGGAGSATHIACALLNAAIGISPTHIPYRGGAPAMQDLIGGRIDYLCLDTPLAMPQIESRTVKAIAILTRARARRLPALASAHEQGLTDFEASNWCALFLPKRTPAGIVRRLHDAAVGAMETAAVQEKLQQIGASVVAPDRRSPEYLQNFVTSEIARWAAPIRASGVSMD